MFPVQYELNFYILTLNTNALGAKQKLGRNLFTEIEFLLNFLRL